jgi:hypothetical protein
MMPEIRIEFFRGKSLLYLGDRRSYLYPPLLTAHKDPDIMPQVNACTYKLIKALLSINIVKKNQVTNVAAPNREPVSESKAQGSRPKEYMPILAIQNRAMRGNTRSKIRHFTV